MNAKKREWTGGPLPRRAGVSSFGLGGTNAHAVLEEAPASLPSSPAGPVQLLMLSAKTAPALEQAGANLLVYLQKNPEANLADVAFTLQAGRQVFPHRQILVCRDNADAVKALTARDAKRLLGHHGEIENPKVIFMFTGQGAQHLQMAGELYRTEPVFRDELDRCAEILRPLLKADLREILYPDANEAKAMERLLTETRIAQPALFSIEYALATLWMSWGVKPAALIGHSIGEYVAACISGVFSLEDALALVARRGALMQGDAARRDAGGAAARRRIKEAAAGRAVAGGGGMGRRAAWFPGRRRKSRRFARPWPRRTRYRRCCIPRTRFIPR